MPTEPITRFKDLETHNIVHPNIVRALTEHMGLETMTEVQTRTLNEAIKGVDVIAQARTGTGKTLAFLLPILQRIINDDPSIAERGHGRRGRHMTADDIRGLIISPTRELAEQIAVEAKKLCRNTGIIVQTAVGGTQKSAGLRAIQREGCHLLVGTPGRLKDILSDRDSRVEAPDLQALVFDEADRLLDQGFWPDVQDIMRLLPDTVEKDRQTLMFSATLPKEVVRIVRSTLKPGFNFVKCVRDDEEPTHVRVPQKSVSLVGLENCVPALIELCQRAIEASRSSGTRPYKAVVFFNSTAEVTLATSVLLGLREESAQHADNVGRGKGAHPWYPIRIFEIHAKLSQQQRSRAADDFRSAQSGILLSSDVTARGMDFPDVTHVIQIGLPPSREQYIHRLGRTARAGKEGEGWIFLNPVDQAEARSRLRDLNLTKDDTLQIPKMDLTQPADVPAYAGRILSMYQNAIKSVALSEKTKVYLAQFGIYQWFNRKQQLVHMINNLSRFGWGLSTPPCVPPGLAARLRLKKLEGIVVGEDLLSLPEDRRGEFGSSGRGEYTPRESASGSSFGNRGGDGGEYQPRRPSYGRDGSGYSNRGDRNSSFGDRGGRSSYGGGRGRSNYGGERGRSNYGGERGNYGRGRPERSEASGFY